MQRAGLRRLPSRIFSRRLLVGHGLSMAADSGRYALHGLAPRAAHPDDGCAAQARRSSRVRAGRAGTLLCACRRLYRRCAGAVAHTQMGDSRHHGVSEPESVHQQHHAFPVEGLRVRDCRSVSGRAAAGCAFFTGGKPFPRALSRAWRDAQPVRHSAAQRHGDGFGRGRVAADRSAPKVETHSARPAYRRADDAGHSRAAVSGVWHRAPAHAAGRDVRRSDDDPGQHL